MKTAHTLTALALAALLSTSVTASAQERRRDAGSSHERPNREQILERFDTNQDGRLDQQERDAARKAIGQQRDAARKAIWKQRDAAHKTIGRQGDGPRSNVGERGTSPKQRGERPMPAELLKRFDKDKDGKLDEAERVAARKAFWQQRDKRGSGDDEQGTPHKRRGAQPILSEILKHFDKNKDGKLDEAERAAARKALAERHGRDWGGERRRRTTRGDGRGGEGGARPPQHRRRGDDGPPRGGKDKGNDR